MEPAGRQVSLAPMTTLRAGGMAAELLEAETQDELVEAVQRADKDRASVLVLGGGSNLVVGDSGFPGLVVHVGTSGVAVTEEPRGAWVHVTAEAGEPFSDLVERCVREGLAGLECMAAIPGTVGAVPVQNVGAYGQEVSQTITHLHVLDRELGQVVVLPAASCGFGYRTSQLRSSQRWLVLSVTFRLRRSPFSEPLVYDQLARALGVHLGERPALRAVFDAVVALRRAKAMVLDPSDPDTRSVGSFFTNPVLTTSELHALLARVAQLVPGAVPPTFPAAGGRAKVSAAWLVEHAGFPRGYTLGPARVSTKHALALVLLEGASTEPLLELARRIRRGVQEAFGVLLQPEPILVGASL